jgi:hypothetical protein
LQDLVRACTPSARISHFVINKKPNNLCIKGQFKYIGKLTPIGQVTYVETILSVRYLQFTYIIGQLTYIDQVYNKY